MSPTRLPEKSYFTKQTSKVHNNRQFVASSSHCSTSVNSNKIPLTYSEPSLNDEQGRYVAEFSGCLSSSAKYNHCCASQLKFMIRSYVVTNHALCLTIVSHSRTAFNVQRKGFPFRYFFQRTSFRFNSIFIIFPSSKLRGLFGK